MSDIFRKKTLDKMNQPDDVNDYIRITRPSLWLVLLAIALLVIGVVAWIAFSGTDLHSVIKQQSVTTEISTHLIGTI